MSEPLAPLDPELGALLRSERESTVVSATRREAMLERLDRSVAVLGAAAAAGVVVGAATAAASTTTRLGLLQKLWTAPTVLKAALGVAFVGGTVVGSVTTATVMQRPATPVAPVAPRVELPAPSVSVVPLAKAPAEIEEVPVPAPSASSVAPPSSAARTEQERPLLDRARVALSQGNPSGALVALTEHGRRYGEHAALAEEREVLRIRALVASGRTGEARSHLTAFQTRYPHSVFLAGLQQAVPPP